jgi:thiamine biosynthesis lipoprotein
MLLDAMQRAWELTGGRFDPTVGPALGELGYGRSWPLLAPPIRVPRARRSSGLTALAGTAGLAGSALDPRDGMVRLPAGVTLDPGGLGKGLAADIVAAELMARGADGVLVNVGGDLRVIGTPPDGDGQEWLVAVEHPDHVDTLDGTPVHHLIDPATSLPAVTTRRQVTVVAGCAWWAEALAKVAFLDGTMPDVQAGALVVEHDGRTRSIGRLDRFARQLEAAR